MLEIVLARHGRPLVDHRSRIRGREFGAWVAGFEQAPLDATLPPPPSLLARAAVAQCIVTSTLRRSVESAALLAPGRPVLSESLFVEAGMPIAMPGSLAIRPKHWDPFSRIAWMFGWSKGTESWEAARRRAKRAAERLNELAREHGSVFLVGHGMLNALIQRALRANGWSGGGWRSAFWSYVVLTRPE
jgi:broad specificity phosphatase PhoE